MSKFKNYIALRERFELCASLVENDIDVEAMCDHIKAVVTTAGRLDEADLQLEFMAGLRAGLAGAGNAAGYAAGAGGRMGGNAFNSAMGAAKKVGGAIMNKAGEMGSRAMAGASSVGKGMADAGMQGYQASLINNAMRQIDGLEKFLVTQKMGDPEAITQHLQAIKQQVTQMGQQNQTMGSRFGQGGMGIAGAYPG
jgi:hypothetical protein